MLDLSEDQAQVNKCKKHEEARKLARQATFLPVSDQPLRWIDPRKLPRSWVGGSPPVEASGLPAEHLTDLLSSLLHYWRQENRLISRFAPQVDTR